MRPYPLPATFVLMACICLMAMQLCAYGATEPPGNAGKPGPSAVRVLGSRLSTVEPLASRGIMNIYALKYDEAIADFERIREAHSTDPFAVNYLLQAVLLKELYRLNALDTTLYADNGFLTGKPLAGDPGVKAQIQQLSDESLRLSEARLKTNPNDVDAIYARGVTRGLRLTYSAIVEKSFFSALRNAVASRNDHERVLELDPNYINAKFVVGVHNFVLGSLPFTARLLVGVAGIGGNKKKGLEYLEEVGNSSAETSTDARVALALFLRREARYEEALKVARSLTSQYPKNFIFALEEANLLKDAGLGEQAIDAYSHVLKNGKAGAYAEPHLERATYGLAESLKGQHRTESALDAYLSALSYSNIQPELKVRALLGAAQMYDLLQNREAALKNYQAVILLDSDSSQAALARQYLKQPFKYLA